MDIHSKIKEITGITDREIIVKMQDMTLQQYVSLFSAIEADDNEKVKELFS